MTATDFPSGMACPGCAAAPALTGSSGKTSVTATEETLLSLPAVHCAACISAVEQGLATLPGVAEARLNLTLKRARIRHDQTVTPEDLIAALARLGYEAMPMDMVALSSTEADRVSRDLLMRLGVAFFAMMNVMLLSVAVWSGASDATRDVFHLISAAIALPTVAFSGQPFFRSAYASLRAGRLGMDVPISLALVLASGISVFETLHSGHHAYFDAAVMLTFFLLGGRYLDQRTRAAARSAAQELAALEVPRALRVTKDGEKPVAVSELTVGDLVRVLPGGRIPVDGTVADGRSEIDQSLLTGESLPVAIGPGQAVAAGATNLTGPLTLAVTAAGRDSSLSRIAALVAVAEEARGRYVTLAERAARLYSPLVHILSFTAFAVWMWLTGGDWRVAINISAAVLIITCPCALGLAVPAVVTSASGKLFRKGILIKDGTALERLATVDTVVFDKTGTLTMGLPRPLTLDTVASVDSAILLALASASAHPLASAIAAALRQSGEAPATLDDIAEVPGYGVEAHHRGRRIRLGRAAWVGAEQGTDTASWFHIEGAAPVEIRFSDSLRPGAQDLVRALRNSGLSVHMLSGDIPGPVTQLAASVGIDDWTAEATPAEKVAHIRALTDAGHKVLMIGDGLNDTGALAAATVSISPGSALDAARVASDMVLIGQSLAPVEDALRIARQSTRRIRENFAISAGYNVIAVPIALMGLATPLIAAAAMSLSSITVTLNALRMR